MHLIRYNTANILPILRLRKTILGYPNHLFPLLLGHLPARMDLLADKPQQFFALASRINPVFIFILRGYGDSNNIAFSIPVHRDNHALDCCQVVNRMSPQPKLIPCQINTSSQ